MKSINVRKGGNIKRSMKHQFEENLICKYCGRGWRKQQSEPMVCERFVVSPSRTPKVPRVPQTKSPHDPRVPDSVTPPQSHSPPTPSNEPVREGIQTELDHDYERAEPGDPGSSE